MSEDQLKSKEAVAQNHFIKARVLWEDSRRLTKNERLRALSCADSALHEALWACPSESAWWPIIAASRALVLAEYGGIWQSHCSWDENDPSGKLNHGIAMSNLDHAREMAELAIRHEKSTEDTRARLWHLVEPEVFGGPQ